MTLKNITAEEILESNDGSSWLKNSIQTGLYGRDLVDMLNDIEVLQAVLNNELRDRATRFNEAINKAEENINHGQN